jgi:hypothetical protein
METQVRGRDVLDGSIGRSDLNVLTIGQAVIRRILEVANSGVKVTNDSTGADAGTGDVKLALDITYLSTLYNAKLNGTGLVRMNGTSVFYDSTVYYHSGNLPAYPTRATLAIDLVNNTADANKSVNYAYSAGTAGSAYVADRLFVADTRDAVTTPNTYTTPSARFDFKSNVAAGLNDGGGYMGLFSFRRYGSSTDWSGGGATQLGFTDAGNLWTRYGSGDAWGIWHKIWHDGNFNPASYLPLTGGTLTGPLNGGVAMSGGWNRTAVLSDPFPGLVFNSSSSRYASINYDYSSNFVIRVGATSLDTFGTGISAMTINAISGSASFCSHVEAAGHIQAGDWVGAPSGISLYSAGNNSGTYGIQFVPTGTTYYGSHGAVTGDYATYFNMDGSPNRGWIFRSGNYANVASINNAGIITAKQLTIYNTAAGTPYPGIIVGYDTNNDYRMGYNTTTGNMNFISNVPTQYKGYTFDAKVRISGVLNIAESDYTGTLKLGTNATWNCGISQRDAGNAEMRIWAKNATLGSIYIATGHDGELAPNTLPTDGLCVKNNKVGIGNFPSYAFPSYNLEVQGSGYFGSLYVNANLNVNGNFIQEITHGQNHQLNLSAADNGLGSGSISLYTWISEPGITWTGAAIARNMSNTSGFLRVNTGMSGQMMRFDEGNGIEFKIETAGGARYTPLSINTNDATFGGNVQINGSVTANGGGFNSQREIKNIHNDWGGNALNVISKFKIRDFNYKTRSDFDRTLGFIIDEVPEEIGDYALSGMKRDAVNTYTLHGLSFLAHQETKTEIEILKERIKVLEGRLN